MPKITKARGATSQLDGSNLLQQESGAEKEPEASAASPAPPAGELERPNVKDRKDAWLAYATQLGVDTEDADGKELTKKKLIAAVDAAE